MKLELNLILILLIYNLQHYTAANKYSKYKSKEYSHFHKHHNIKAKNSDPCYFQSVSQCNPNVTYRRFDGSCNNLENPTWGVPNSTYARLLPPKYGDGISGPRKGYGNYQLPSARKVRTELLPKGSEKDEHTTIVTMQWGQVLAHDMSLQMDPPHGPCCSGDARFQSHAADNCFPISIPRDDPDLGSEMRCMNFTRTVSTGELGCNPQDPVEKINMVTPWIDLSIVYDNDNASNDDLRTGQNGSMKVDDIGGGILFPPKVYDPDTCSCNLPNETICFKGGDSRMNQSPHLLLIQTILLREHNRLAAELSNINPQWSDEKIFQEARRINIAQFQHISYYEWMPVLLGYENLVKAGIIFPESDGFVDDYDSKLSPDVTNEHAHGAYKIFHSKIAEMLSLIDENQHTSWQINIGSHMQRPGYLAEGDNSVKLIRGMLLQPPEATDKINVPAISNKFIACKPDIFGMDLRAVDIQRDRDHGLAYYNDYRGLCCGKKAKSFEDFGDLISKKNIKKMKKVYRSFMDVDLTVGGGLEKKVPGAQVGPTFLCIILEQFKRSRQADRLWYEHEESGFTIAQLNEIRKTSLARLICDNENNIKTVPRNSFVALKELGNHLIPCSLLPSVDLQLWKTSLP